MWGDAQGMRQNFGYKIGKYAGVLRTAKTEKPKILSDKITELGVLVGSAETLLEMAKYSLRDADL